jgi:DNA uptake protein ComE-like DNA-binding protein
MNALVLTLALAAGLAVSAPEPMVAAQPDSTTRVVADTLAMRPALVRVNDASVQELIELGLPADVAEAVIDHRTYVSYFNSLFDLLEVPGMTTALLAKIRGRIEVAPVFETARREQRERSKAPASCVPRQA